MPPSSVRIRRAQTSRELVERGALSVGVAVVTAVLVRTVAGTVVAVPPSFQPLAWSSVVAVTVVAGAGATLAYALVDRFTERTVRNFLALAAAVFVLMAVPLVTTVPALPGATPALVALLFVLHVVVAVGIVVPLVRGRVALSLP